MSVSKRLALLVAGWAIVTAIVLILPPFTTRGVFALLTLSLLVVVLLYQRFSRSSSHATTTLEREERDEHRQLFPVDTLFGATIDNMQEGLLVVDRDMRVVASNP